MFWPITKRKIVSQNAEVRMRAYAAIRKSMGGHISVRKRKEIADALRSCDDTEAQDILLTMLRDENESVRSSAATALGKAGNTQVIRPLLEGLKDTEASVRVAVADALSVIQDPRCVDALTGALDDRNQDVVAAVRNALKILEEPRFRKEIQSGSCNLDVLVSASKIGSVEIRRLIVEKLGEKQDARATDILIQMLNDEDVVVRRMVVNTLRNKKTDIVLEALISAYSPQDPSVQEFILFALADFEGERSFQFRLDAMMNKTLFTDVRAAAVRSLTYLDDRRLIEPFLSLCSDPSKKIRDYARCALAQYDDLDPKISEMIMNDNLGKTSGMGINTVKF